MFRYPQASSQLLNERQQARLTRVQNQCMICAQQGTFANGGMNSCLGWRNEAHQVNAYTLQLWPTGMCGKQEVVNIIFTKPNLW